MNTEQKLYKQIEKLEQNVQDIRSRKMITCPECKKRTPISKATIVKDYWHVPPRGCMEGDYWKFNEYWYCCLKCMVTSRVYVGSWNKDWDTGKIKPEALKVPRVILFKFIDSHIRYFGEVLESYSDGRMSLDELREKNRERKERSRL